MGVLIVVGIVVAAIAAGAWRVLRRRSLDRWLVPYVLESGRRRAPRAGSPIHVLLCVCDHYEPRTLNAPAEVAQARVRNWVEQYPRLFGGFRDSDGRSPCHTFFYPIEQYDAEHMEMLAGLCRAGFGEVEVHLHHDRDNAESMRRRLLKFRHLLVERHRLLSRHRRTRKSAYGFIHGDWALDNSHPAGECCGVDDELSVLRQTGCYADFTLPSAPDPTQTRKINSIYYAASRPGQRKSHDRGVDVGVGSAPPNSLMLIQGPLLLDWRNRKWGIAPRIENGCLQASQPPGIGRLDLWLRARVQVPSRPDWFFVKLHCHGAPECHQRMLLGEPMARFHQDLAARAQADPLFHYHYVSAREMYNLARAAETRWTGSVDSARNFELISNLHEHEEEPGAETEGGFRSAPGSTVQPADRGDSAGD